MEFEEIKWWGALRRTTTATKTKTYKLAYKLLPSRRRRTRAEQFYNLRAAVMRSKNYSKAHTQTQQQRSAAEKPFIIMRVFICSFNNNADGLGTLQFGWWQRYCCCCGCCCNQIKEDVLCLTHATRWCH